MSFLPIRTSIGSDTCEARFAEREKGFSWTEIIEGGLFEYFERLTLTDIKPQVFERIKANEKTFTELKKEFVIGQKHR
jgi:hypothetical protein